MLALIIHLVQKSMLIVRANQILHDLMLRLMAGYLNKGFNITMDNFFTSYSLAQTLFKQKTTFVGTIRLNKPHSPRELTDAQAAR